MPRQTPKNPLPGLALLWTLGCASTVAPAPQPPIPSSEEPARSTMAGPGSPSDESRRAESPDPGGQDIARLCESLRHAEALSFEGNEVGQARAREAHEQRRQAALEATQVTLVPARGFSFRGYDLATRQLSVDTTRSFVLGQGVELVVSEPRELAFPLAPDAAEALLESHERDSLRLRLVFRPGQSQLHRDVCLRLSGGRVVKLPIEVLSYALVGADGTALAERSTPGFAEVSLATSPVSQPEIRTGRPRTTDGREVGDQVAAAMRGLAAALLPCYEQAIKKRPTLRGTLVLDLRVTGGRIESPRMEMSTLEDDELVACAVKRAERARLDGVTGPLRLSLPMTFGARDDR